MPAKLTEFDKQYCTYLQGTEYLERLYERRVNGLVVVVAVVAVIIIIIIIVIVVRWW
jgi:predicted RND superfamily exporter protein